VHKKKHWLAKRLSPKSLIAFSEEGQKTADTSGENPRFAGKLPLFMSVSIILAEDR